MADFEVRTNKLNVAANDFDKISKHIRQVSEETKKIMKDTGSSITERIAKNLQRSVVCGNINNSANDFSNLSSGLKKITLIYSACESDMLMGKIKWNVITPFSMSAVSVSKKYNLNFPESALYSKPYKCSKISLSDLYGKIKGMAHILAQVLPYISKYGENADVFMQSDKEKAYFEENIQKYLTGEKTEGVGVTWNNLDEKRITSYSCWAYTKQKLEYRGFNYNKPQIGNSSYTSWAKSNGKSNFTNTAADYFEYLLQENGGEPIYNIRISNGSSGKVHTMLIDKLYVDEKGEIRVIFSDQKDTSKPIVTDIPRYENGRAKNEDNLQGYYQMFDTTDMSLDEFRNGYSRDGKQVWTASNHKAPTEITVYGKQP